jgi:nucleotide-binding universal stress UspA family protein
VLRTHSLGAEPPPAEETEMPSRTEPLPILVAVDGSAESIAAVAWAARECALRQAPATLVHVVLPAPVSVPVEPLFNPPDWYERSARHILRHAERDFLSSWGSRETADVRLVIEHGGVVPALVAESDRAQMVVVGSRGVGAVERLTLGSVSSGVLHHARCPVVIVRAGQSVADSRLPIALGVDGSPASEAATAMAFDEASRRGVDLVAQHAWSDAILRSRIGGDDMDHATQGREVLAERLAGWQERYPDVRVHRRLVCDDPAHSLIEESRRAQLLVVGSRGRGNIAGALLGSTSVAVAQRSLSPVMVVAAPTPRGKP